MNPLSPFLRLFRIVGWPPPFVFVQGLAPVLVWHVLGALVPEASDQVKVSWAVLAFFTVLTWTRCRITLERAKRDGLDHVRIAKLMFGYWVVLAAFIYVSQGLAWVQHWITVALAFHAFVHLTEFLVKADLLCSWDNEDFKKKAGPVLCAAFTLFYAALALLNETLIAQVSFEAWMIWLAIFPLLLWLLSRALWLTVLFSLEDRN